MMTPITRPTIKPEMTMIHTTGNVPFACGVGTWDAVGSTVAGGTPDDVGGGGEITGGVVA